MLHFKRWHSVVAIAAIATVSLVQRADGQEGNATQDIEKHFQSQIELLEKATPRSPCIKAVLIALKDKTARELFLKKAGNRCYVLKRVCCLDLPRIREYEHVLFDFDCAPSCLCFVDPQFVVTVDRVNGKIVEIKDPYQGPTKPCLPLFAADEPVVSASATTYSAASADRRHVSLRSTYLTTPIEGFRHLTLVGDLKVAGGTGHIELNPNRCVLNDFGDRDTCTLLPPTARTVSLHQTRTSDPLKLNRQLWVVSGTSLQGVLFLVLPENANGPHRLVYKSRSGERIVVPMEPLVYHKEKKKLNRESNSRLGDVPQCEGLARTVDGVKAMVQVRPGFVNGTYFLSMQGRKPNANTWVAIKPHVYKKQPTYWRIVVQECSSGGVSLPAVTPYRVSEEITKTIGTKGIEVYWSNGEKQRFDIQQD